MFFQWHTAVIVIARLLHLGHLAYCQTSGNPSTSTSLERPSSTDEVMNGVMKNVWNKEFVPKFEELDLDWDMMERVAAERQYLISTLVLKGAKDAYKLVWRADEAFVHQLSPLRDTQLTFRELIDIADDESLTTIYASFLAAPLDTEEEKTAARAALCRVWSRPSNCSLKGRPNYFEFQDASARLFATVGKVWAPDHPEKAEKFFRRLLGFGDVGEESQKFEELKVMAADEPLLKKALDDFIYEFNVPY
ncbi:hypothetical protein CkaCkLH20_00611 [Colletotrichum karsti]|uniref:Uncharacterized protein n=1 Tax=Colletotrichum karsti TaxID=1095194 RepID=A0A9P6IEW6_9PEZI|nr:uncharacterized protein CkaCkLH20_00611 [Colletotrichum karsti]KAF9881465.1 hypothetical protein CkaCkLH20_00611 [Colletotrichum karsti]